MISYGVCCGWKKFACSDAFKMGFEVFFSRSLLCFLAFRGEEEAEEWRLLS